MRNDNPQGNETTIANSTAKATKSTHKKHDLIVHTFMVSFHEAHAYMYAYIPTKH